MMKRIWPYREIDALGGDDPYSASKACSEIAAHSYWHSFFRDTAVNISTVRAGKRCWWRGFFQKIEFLMI